MEQVSLHIQKRWPELVAVVLCVGALVSNLQAVDGLEWPGESDFYRDMGSAYSVLEGRWGDDPAYRGESAWYPPLVPTLVAAVSALTGSEPRLLYSQAGPFFNLIAPIAFFIMVSVLLGRRAAVLSLAAFLFLGDPLRPSMVQATYSPWLWPQNFVQGLLYLTITSFAQALKSDSRRWDVATGVLLGLTFLGHPAPALVGALVVGGVFMARARHNPRKALQRLALIGGVAVLQSAPFLFPLIAHYHFVQANPSPGSFAAMRALWIIKGQFAWTTALALVGVYAAWRSRKWLIIASGAAALLLLSYGMTAQFLAPRGTQLPVLVPPFHFHFYVEGFKAALFGAGAAIVGSWVANWLKRPQWHWPLAVALTAALCMTTLPDYGERFEISTYRSAALAYSADSDTTALFKWARESANSRVVVLAPPTISLYAIAAAGRHVLVLPRNFSNPYVPFEPRQSHAQAMNKAINNGDVDGLRALAADYDVTHVVTKNCPNLPTLAVLLALKGHCLYKL